MKILSVVVCVIILSAYGCAPALSNAARDQVTYSGTFRSMAASPLAYTGEVVLLGGRIIENQPSDEGSRLTVLHLPLNSWNRPVHPDRSEGRYLLKTGGFMDPEIFKKDRLITVAGTVTGEHKGMIESYKYSYPVIEILEIKAWENGGVVFPQIYFGIGVGTHF